MLTKKLKFDDDVLEVISLMEWKNDGKLGILTSGTLDRKLYVSVNKALEAMGGKWSKKDKGHVFENDPRENVEGLLNNGVLEVDRDGFFRTPNEVINKMFEIMPPNENALILEPSAGDGAIIRKLIEYGIDPNLIMAVEINNKRAKIISKEFSVDIFCKDFMLLDFPCEFDQIYMNPPFENNQDIKHIMKAFDHLSPGGELISVVSEHPFFATDQLSHTFRTFMKENNAHVEKLQQNSFKSSGTMVEARLIMITN